MKKSHIIIILIIILFIAAFFRLYRIGEYMIFLGDEGRDVLVVKRILIDHKFTLLGPITSVGSMYIGPIYYYFMAPFLLLWGFNPVGPAVMVALFAVATTGLIFYILNKYFSFKSAIIASFLYAISPLTIIHGRSSWNPNIVPFFSILIILGLLKTFVEKKPRWLLLSGLALGIILQLHYIALMFAPIIFVTLIINKPKFHWKYYLYMFLGFLITISPFLAFELRHNFPNLRSVISFLTPGTREFSFGITKFIHTFSDILTRLFWRLVIIENAEITKILIIFIFITLIFVYIKSHKYKKFLQIIFLWFILGLISYSLYRGSIYDYYLVPLFPLPFIMTAIFIDRILQIKRSGLIIGILLLGMITFFNLKKNPQLFVPNNLLKNTETTSQFVNKMADNKPYNFALIAGKNSDHAYRYFLELWGNPPVVIENPVIDPDRKSVTETLLVVCEEKVCQPLGHPLWEIAGFGQAEIAGEWKVSTARVFKLVHYKKL